MGLVVAAAIPTALTGETATLLVAVGAACLLVGEGPGIVAACLAVLLAGVQHAWPAAGDANAAVRFALLGGSSAAIVLLARARTRGAERDVARRAAAAIADPSRR